ncbi:MAG: Na(+)-translocating NADH-quinone reductase subunit A [Candidatus Latescibacterota bacterium]
MARRFRIRKGLDLPIAGAPEQVIEEGRPVSRVAVLGPDYIGLRPTMAVAEGDPVALGQALFVDRSLPGVVHTSPASGRVVAINRGPKRALLSVVVQVEGNAEVTFPTPATLTREHVAEQLLASGLWVGLRARPYSKVADPQTTPRSLFVSAMDTRPLAADPQVVLRGREEDFAHGLAVLAHLTEGPVYLCVRPGFSPPVPAGSRVEVCEFEGPHPAGLPGTHIHLLDPVGRGRLVWHIDYQDVVAVGRLFRTGRLGVERVVSLAGPQVHRPRLLRARLGADIDQLVEGELMAGDNRVVSGSVLCGRQAAQSLAFLGRYHLQVAVLREGRERVFLGWQTPGLGKFSVTGAFLSRLMPGRRFALSTSLEGSRRAMVPIGTYEKVMPLDMLPTQLLRALVVQDTERAQALGCLELDEEDLALCTFACPGKYEYGPILRQNLTLIEREG